MARQILALLTAAASAPPALAVEATTHVVVYDLAMNGLTDRQQMLITGSLLAEIRKLENISAVGVAAVRRAKAATALGDERRCYEDRNCLVALADGLGTDTLVTGTVVRLGRSSVFTLKRMSLRSGSVVETATRRLVSAGGEELLLVVGDLVAEIFPDQNTRVGLPRGVNPAVIERMDPPPFAPWFFFAGLGATAVTAGIMTSYFVRQRRAEQDWRALVSKSSEEVVDGRKLKRHEDEADRTHRLATRVYLPMTLALAIATSVVFFFTDWTGDEAVLPMLVSDGDGAAGPGLFGRF